MLSPDIYSPVTAMQMLPELILLAAGCAALLLGQSSDTRTRGAVPWVALVGVFLALVVLTISKLTPASVMPAGGGLLFDGLADFVRTSTLIVGFALVLVAWYQPAATESGEFFGLTLFSLIGLMLTGLAADLLVLFLALELVSIPTYVMVTLSRSRAVALEAGTKYFYLGAMSAAVMGYGFALLYGVAGTTALHGPDGAIQAVAAALLDPAGGLRFGLALTGLTLAIGGLLFKIAAVPLHFYIADVYQGAASPVAGFLGFVPKLAGFAALIKILTAAGWQTTHVGLFWTLWLTAALSMTVGNVLALRQNNLKRMLAYSGIAHSGYMLVGLMATPLLGGGMLGDGAAAVLYYTVVYGLANLGAFALLALLRRQGQPAETIQDVAGLLARSPGLALLMALLMFTLMGLPPTAGFWGKLTLFGSALSLSQAAETPLELRSWVVALVIIGMVNSAIGAAYYLRVVAAVLLYENDEAAEPAPREAVHLGGLLCGMLLVILTFYPNLLLRNGRAATSNIRQTELIRTVKDVPSTPAVAASPLIEPR